MTKISPDRSMRDWSHYAKDAIKHIGAFIPSRPTEMTAPRVPNLCTLGGFCSRSQYLGAGTGTTISPNFEPLWVRFTAPNNSVRSHKTAAEPRLTALCNSRAPPAALGRQESVRRVVVRKSVARTHAAPCGPVPTRLDLHSRRAEP
jgi:hypothetical protein